MPMRSTSVHNQVLSYSQEILVTFTVECGDILYQTNVEVYKAKSVCRQFVLF